MTNTILFYLRLETQFLELIRVYHLLASDASIKIKLQFLFEDLPLSVLERMLDYCKMHNMEYDVVKIVPCHQRLSLPQRIKGFLCHHLGGSKGFLYNLYYETNFFLSYFTSKNVKLIFVGEDGIGISPSLFCAANKLKIPSLVVPYEYSQKQQAIESILANERPIQEFKPQTWKQQLFFLLFRKWQTSYQNQTFLRLPTNITIPIIFFNYGPKLPWAVHGGLCSKLLCDSERMKDLYYQEGIKKQKIKLIGNLGHDEMHKLLKTTDSYWKAYDQGTFIDHQKIKILFSFPPDYTSRKQSAFIKYYDFIDYWIKLSQISDRIVPFFQVHPSVTEEQRNYIKSKGISLETENIVQLIPKIDLLITSVSSIIRLAIALRKPVLNFDLYQFNNPDYVNVPGVTTMVDAESFSLEFSKISNDPHYVESLKQTMKQESQRWAILDGNVKERFLNEIRAYIEQPL